MSLVSTIAPAALGLLVAGGSYLYSRHLQASARGLRESRAQVNIAAAEAEEPSFPSMGPTFQRSRYYQTKAEAVAGAGKVMGYVIRKGLRGADIADAPSEESTPKPGSGVRAKP